jgi:hypothetical protein
MITHEVFVRDATEPSRDLYIFPFSDINVARKFVNDLVNVLCPTTTTRK